MCRWQKNFTIHKEIWSSQYRYYFCVRYLYFKKGIKLQGKNCSNIFKFKQFRIIFFRDKNICIIKNTILLVYCSTVITSSPSYRSSSWSSSCWRALAAPSCRNLWALLPSSFLVGSRSLCASRMWSESTDLVVNQLEQWGHGSPSPSCSSES